jgi:4-hydroxybenzoate polyprenyltransferase
MSIAERLALYAQLTRLDKPVGTLLLLWPTLTGLWIAAGGLPQPLHLAIFVVGTLLMRSAGCAMNDVADRHYDIYVKRTAHRVVAAGRLSAREALGVAAVLVAASALLLLPLNGLTFWLAVMGLVVAASYPLFKRFFPLPQAWLGVAFSFGIPMSFAAVQATVPPVALWLCAANLFWVVAYDTEYAMVDRDDDLRIGVRSSAILFGRADVAAVGACYAVHLALLLVVGWQIGASWPYALGLMVAAALAMVHLTWIRGREREACFRAFRHNTWIGCAVFAGVVAHYARV